MKLIVIAIDGVSSSGKSTLAKSLARVLRYIYIDSGAMYRCVTLYALRNNLIRNSVPLQDLIIKNLRKIKITFHFDQAIEKNTTFMNGEDVEELIRKIEVSENVSPVSTIREVRREMVKQQQTMGKKKGIVMDGRDIGTVVFPAAELKIFLTATPEIRAKRRFLELKGRGHDVNYEEVLKNINERDYIDSNRSESPLRIADDALILDNSSLTPEEQLRWALDRVEEITGMKYESIY